MRIPLHLHRILAATALSMLATGCEKQAASTPASLPASSPAPIAKGDSPAPPPAASEGLRSPRSHSLESLQLAIEVADSPAERSTGLSSRRSLDWNRGMLFVFPDLGMRSFWMIDCHFDIDIAYLDPHGVVRDLQTMFVEPGVPPDQLRRYPSATSDIRYALEVNRNWFATRMVSIGDTIPEIAEYRTKE